MTDQPTYGRIGSRTSRILFKVWTLVATVLLVRMSLVSNDSAVTKQEVQVQAR